MITYEVFSGGTGGTLLAEYQVSSLLQNGTRLFNFTPTFLTSGLSSPGELASGQDVISPTVSEFRIVYAENNAGTIQATLTSSQVPTIPGTYALDTSQSGGISDSGNPLLSADTLVIMAPTTATPEPASLTLQGLGAAGLVGYRWRRQRPKA
jgi:hypothetical protein